MSGCSHSRIALADLMWNHDEVSSDASRQRAVADMLLDSGDEAAVIPEVPLRFSYLPSYDLRQPIDLEATGVGRKRPRDDDAAHQRAIEAEVAEHTSDQAVKPALNHLEADSNWKVYRTGFVRTGFPAAKRYHWTT